MTANFNAWPDLLAWPLGLMLLFAGFGLTWHYRRFHFLHWSGPWACAGLTAGLVCLGLALQVHEAGLWPGSFLAIPAMMTGACVLAGLDTLTPPPPDESEGRPFIVTPLWPIFVCLASIAAVMLITLLAPASHRLAIAALLALHAVAAARLSWWQCSRVGSSLAQPLILLIPVFAVLAIALLARNSSGRELAWPAMALGSLLCAWIVKVKSIETGNRRTPRPVREALQSHFASTPGQAVVLLRFGLTLQATSDDLPVPLEADLQERAGAQVSRILQGQFRTGDHIVQEAPLQWSVICVNAGPTELAMLAVRMGEQITSLRLPDGRDGLLTCSLVSGISARCDSIAAGESGWWQAGAALQRATMPAG